MNAKVHPLIAALVLVATLAAVALWTWASGHAASFGGPAELTMDPRGHSFVQIQNYLVEHDADGAYLKTHSLEDMGVELVLGGHAFFSNGDVLLRRGSDPRSFMDNFRAYSRETNRNSIIPESPGNGLSRCDLEIRYCAPFGAGGIDFKAAFSVFIDWPTDEVYISDTTRHLLRKYSSEGVELAPPVGDFHFPNQLMLHDGQLLVADTNHHEIRVLESETKSFGERIDNIGVVTGAAKSVDHRWPSHFARVGEQWWVNNMQTGMNNGGVYVFDNDWGFDMRVDLPSGADPISILNVGDTVWISDWNNDVVRRFTLAGDALSNLESEGLQAILSDSVNQRRHYTLLSFAGVIVVGLMFIGLLAQAFARNMNTDPSRQSGEVDASTSTQDSGPLHLEPDTAAMKKMTAATRAAVILAVLALLPLIFLLQTSENPEIANKLIGPVLGIFAIVGLVAWANRANWGTSIVLDGDRLTLTDYAGRQSTCSVRQARYDNTAIATQSGVVMLGRPQHRIYAEADITERLMPRLADAERVNALEMMKIQVALRHPQGLITVIALAGVAIYAVLYFTA